MAEFPNEETLFLVHTNTKQNPGKDLEKFLVKLNNSRFISRFPQLLNLRYLNQLKLETILSGFVAVKHTGGLTNEVEFKKV